MEKILHIDTICDYNEGLGIETLHPLVSVIDFSKAKPIKPARRMFGFYAIFLKDVKCGDLIYGRSMYDYQEGTLVFLAPGQVIGIVNNGPRIQPKGKALLFHLELIKGTPLGRAIDSYTFFSYQVNEALHISEQERHIVLDCLSKIQLELAHAIDKHSRRLIVNNIELLLDYCTRFYERQFITRENVNADVLSRFEAILGAYFQTDRPQQFGLPTVAYCADIMHLSANYFGDLIKKETGKTAQEHIQLKLLDVAKERIFDTGKTVSEIAYELGFKYPQHFTRFFKKHTGLAPLEYRASAN